MRRKGGHAHVVKLTRGVVTQNRPCSSTTSPRAPCASSASCASRTAWPSPVRRAARDAPIVVLDLRGNPGGLIAEAVDTVDVFLAAWPHRLVLGRAHARPDGAGDALGPAARCRSWSSSIAPPRAPPRSSPRRCGDNKRAKVVGTRTFGKASIQAVVEVPGGGAVKLTVATYRTPNGLDIHGRGIRPDVPVRTRAAGARGRRGAPPVIDEEGGPRLVACTVERRGRFLVAQPFFEEGQQLALGRRSGLAVQAGELVVVEGAGGSARVVERLGSPDDVGHVLRALLLQRGLAREWPEDALREARRASREREPDGRACRPARARGDHDRPARRRATSTTPSASSRTATACAPGCTSPTSPATSSRGARSMPRPAAAPAASTFPGRSSRCCRSSSRPTRAACGPARCGASSASRCASRADGKPGAPHVRRALIRSSARLTYDEAHEVLAGRRHHPNGDLLARADALARDLRARRHARGAFTLALARARRSSSPTARGASRTGTRSRARTHSSRSSCCSRTRPWAACSRAPGGRRSTACTSTRSTRRCCSSRTA